MTLLNPTSIGVWAERIAGRLRRGVRFRHHDRETSLLEAVESFLLFLLLPLLLHHLLLQDLLLHQTIFHRHHRRPDPQLATLVDEIRPAGADAVMWDGTDANRRAVASGVYLARLVGESGVETRKMALVR